MLSHWTKDIYFTTDLTNTLTYTKFHMDKQSYGYVILVPHTVTNDINLAKFDPDGNTIFTHQFPTFNTNIDILKPEITVDLQGDIYLMYITSDMLSLESIIVLLKLDAIGHRIWIKYCPLTDKTSTPHLQLINNLPFIYYFSNNTLCSYTLNQTQNLTYQSTDVPVNLPLHIHSLNSGFIILDLDREEGLFLTHINVTGHIVWSVLVTNKPFIDTPILFIDEISNIYIVFSTQTKIHIHTFDSIGTLLKKNHILFNDHHDQLTLSIDEHLTIILTYIDASNMLHYYRITHDAIILENYHETLSINQPSMRVDSHGKIYLIAYNTGKLTVIKMKFSYYFPSDTFILMENNMQKTIQDLQLGDTLSTGHIVKNLCYGATCDQELLLFECNVFENYPERNTVLSGDTKFSHNNETHIANIFNKLGCVKTVSIDQTEQFKLYNIQIDADGYYYANGLKVLALK